jgi:O-antigen/teichoic acid export membrane protein
VSITRSVFISFAERYTSEALLFVSSLVLARLLSPEEFGAYGAASAFVIATELVLDSVALGYLLQERELSRERFRTLFGLLCAGGWLAALALIVSADPIGRFFGSAEVARLIEISAIALVLRPLISLANAWFRRELRLDLIMRTNVVGLLGYAMTAILLASHDHGAESIAFGRLLGTAIQCAAVIGQPGTFLQTRPSLTEWRRVGSFCGIATGAVIVANLGPRVRDVLIGRIAGLAPLGIFGRADLLLSLVYRSLYAPFEVVLTGVLATKARSGQEIEASVLLGVTMMTGMLWPSFALLWAFAPEMILAFFGSQWNEAVPVVRILCLAGVVEAAGTMTWPVFHAHGVPRTRLRGEVYSFLAMVSSLAVGVASGGTVTAMTWAWVAGSAFRVLIMTHYMLVLIGCRWRRYGRVLLPSMVVAAVCLVGLIGLSRFLDETIPALARLALAGTGLAAIWLLTVSLIRHPVRAEAFRLYRQIRQRLPLPGAR